MSSKLRFRYGTMSSAKSLLLLATAHNFEEKGIPHIIIKPSVDNRDKIDVVKSRAGLEKNCIAVSDDLNLYNAVIDIKKSLDIKWIFVDECQFLTEKQIDELSDIVDYLDIDVMCYGLRTDFTSHFFPGSKRLMEIADDIEEIKSQCSCGKKTSINARINDKNQIISEGEQIFIGGDESYISLCRKCWKERKKIT